MFLENVQYPPSRRARNYIKNTIPKCYNPLPKPSEIKDAMASKNGHRTFFLKDNTLHRGCWKNNMKHGLGKETDKSTQETYVGLFHENERSGYGVISRRRPNGTQELLYEGQFANGLPYGTGEIHTDSYHFKGKMVNGKASGMGVAWFKDGTIYFGNWYNGKRMGQGIQVHENQNRYEGSWYNDRKHGYGQNFFFDKGYVLDGVWVADVCRCGTMRNIKYRQAAVNPAKYPVPKVMLKDWTTKYYLWEREELANVGKYVREDMGIPPLKGKGSETSSVEDVGQGSDREDSERDIEDILLSKVDHHAKLKFPASLTKLQPCLILNQ